jgi:hypothetical protein
MPLTLDFRPQTLPHDVTEYGAVGDGVTDDTAAIQAALDAAAAANGGTIFVPTGTYLCESAITWPSFVSGVRRQRPIRLTGAAPSNTFGFAASGGAILDLRGGVDGKLELLGHGYAEIDHLTITDGGGSAVPFIFVTNTVVRIHDCSFRGSKVGALCDQDAIIMGGTGTDDDGTTAGPFQGYGSVIADCEFQGIRRAVLAQRFANDISLRNLAVAGNCGTNLAGGAAIEIDGQALGNDAHGTFINGGVIEMGAYPYGIKQANAHALVVVGTGFADSVLGVTLAMIRLEATSTGAVLVPGPWNTAFELVSDASGGAYIALSADSLAETAIPADLWIGPGDPRAAAGPVAAAANVAYLGAFQVHRRKTVTAVRLRIGAASGNIDVGIYDNAGVRLGSSGSVACPAAAVNATVALTAPVTLEPGKRYFAAYAQDNAVATQAVMSGISGPFTGAHPSHSGQAAASFPLPANINVGALAATAHVVLVLFE